MYQNSVLNKGTFLNDEFSDVYIVYADIGIEDIKLLDGEVEAIQFLDLETFSKWIDGKGEPMVPHPIEYPKVLEYFRTVIL